MMEGFWWMLEVNVFPLRNLVGEIAELDAVVFSYDSTGIEAWYCKQFQSSS